MTEIHYKDGNARLKDTLESKGLVNEFTKYMSEVYEKYEDVIKITSEWETSHDFVDYHLTAPVKFTLEDPKVREFLKEKGILEV